MIFFLGIIHYGFALSQNNFSMLDTIEYQEMKLKRGGKIQYQVLTVEQAKIVLKQYDTQLIEREENGGGFFKLSNGKFLSFDEWFGGTIYNSLEDYEAEKEDLETSFNDFPTERVFIDSRGSRIRYLQIMASEGEEMKSNLKGAEDSGYDLFRYKVFYLKTTREILLQPKEEYVKISKVFKTRKDFEMYLSFLKRPSVLTGINLYGLEFEKHIPDLILSIAIQLKIPETKLDKSVESLDLIDKALDDKIINDDLYYDLYLPLVAYIGEVYIKNEGGKWTQQLKGETWEPYIVNKKGQGIYFFGDIYEQMHPNFATNFSMFFTYDGYVNPTFKGVPMEGN